MDSQSTSAATYPADLQPSSFRRKYPIAFLAGVAVAGVAASVAVVWLLVAVANLFTEKSVVAQLDDSVANWLTFHGSTAADRTFAAISPLGGWGLLAVAGAVVILLLVRKDTWRAAAVVAAGAGAVAINGLLHLTFERAHSLSATSFTSAAQSWSFPSGHALNALVVYGILACLVIEQTIGRRTRFWIAGIAVALVAVIGFTRMYLGVHSLSDVVTGYAAGGVWLAVCVAAYRWAREQPAR